MSDTRQLQNMAIAHISLAKTELSDENFSKLDIPTLQKYIMLIDECLPAEYLVDQTLMRHAIEALTNDHSAESAVMLTFLLYVGHLCGTGSNHPLERGIIRQQILGVLPKFEMAVNKGLIKPEHYDKNADALAAIADNSSDVPDLLEALLNEYSRFSQGL